MKKYIFFFLLISLLVCRVNAKEIEIGMLDGNKIVLEENNDYISNEIKYISNEDKIILNNASLNYVLINGNAKEKTYIELIGENHIESNNTYTIQNYNSDLILTGEGKLFLKSDEQSVLYMENSNIYIRTNCDFESKVNNTIYIYKGELIIEQNADVKVKSEKEQAVYIEFGFFEVNSSKIVAISMTNPIVIDNYYLPYTFIQASIKTQNAWQVNSSYNGYYRYFIGHVSEVEISQSTFFTDTYLLKVSDLENGSIKINKNRYALDERLDYEIIPDEGYGYKEGSLTFSQNVHLINENSIGRMQKNGVYVSCEFEEIPKYNVNLSYNKGGTFDKEDSVVLFEGEDYTLHILVNEGYYIKRISINEDNINISNEINIVSIDKDYDIVVEFAEEIVDNDITTISQNNSDNTEMQDIDDNNDQMNIEENEKNNENSQTEEIILNPLTNDNLGIFIVLLVVSLLFLNGLFYMKIKFANLLK